MPPVLDPSKSKVDGLAFLGLSLSRKGSRGHPDSVTHQQAFDLDLLQDRDYEHVFSTNDDGWLVGGGEPGPPTSYKLPAKDSAHVEIMRIGTYEPTWGGVYQKDIIGALQSGKILIPEITVVPTAVVANKDLPPELEIRFDMIPPTPNFDDPLAPLPVNWQLRFIQNQLFKLFEFPSRFNPGSFHSTILRKAEFRSPVARKAYFAKCQKVIDEWMDRGQQPLAPSKIDKNIKVVKCKRVDENNGDDYLAEYYRSGLWLFTDRNTITHHFLPNFLPPYDTPAKRKIILQVLKEEWDESTLSFRNIVPMGATDDKSLSAEKSSTPNDMSALIADYICGSAKQVFEAAVGTKETKFTSTASDLPDKAKDEGEVAGEEKSSKDPAVVGKS